ncbi:MAG: hypothetical protein P8N51_04935, partial [Pseudomonadales bacterium]|nr:hypothetical protein [Pseudomonadales bacterium]
MCWPSTRSIELKPYDQDGGMVVQNIKYLIAVLLLSAFCQSVFAVAPANTDIKAAATLTYTGL